MNQGITINVSSVLVTEECCNCHVLFAMPVELRKVLIDHPGRRFFCPFGHGQHYVGPTEAQRLQRELEEARAKIERVERQKLYLTQCADQDRAAIKDLSNQVRGQKAAKTKLLRRVTNGVCVCCGRSFANVTRHMKSKHPGEVVTADPAAAQQ